MELKINIAFLKKMKIRHLKKVKRFQCSDVCIQTVNYIKLRLPVNKFVNRLHIYSIYTAFGYQ